MEPKDIKVLIIEDEEALVDVLKTKLDKHGFQVEVANDGKEGFDKLQTYNPDMILLDIVMPIMDGYEVLEKMLDEGIKIPVIIISNSGQPVEIEKTKMLGAVDHLVKTQFNPADVIYMIQNYFDDQEMRGGGDDSSLQGSNQSSNDNISSQASDSQLPETSDDLVAPPKPEIPKVILEKIEDPNAQNLGIRVLLVEDDSFLREISTKKLVKEGFTVFQAIDGEMAIGGIESAAPDIVLLDIILPALDGFQILEKIRAHSIEAIAKVPVIMLSNLGQDDDIKKAMALGASDYLVKAHFTTEEIVTKIKETLGK